MSAPSYPVTLANGHTIDLAPFCARADIREYLMKPMKAFGGTVASDGAIIVWVPGVHHDAVEPEPLNRLNDMLSSAQREIAENQNWVEAASIIGGPAKCARCKGVGRLKFIECADCDGEGSFWHGRHEYECQECDGHGSVESSEEADEDDDACVYCQGTGLTLKRTPSSYGTDRFTIDAFYIQKLRALPGCRLVVHKKLPPAGIAFTFDGGLGIVMPLEICALAEGGAP